MIFSKILMKIGLKLIQISKFVEKYNLPKIEDDFKDLRANYAMKKLVMDYEFQTVLDLGSGDGLHSQVFIRYGKKVTSLDYGASVYFKENAAHSVIIADFNNHNFKTAFDCVWCSHVLEHQLNPHSFLTKIHNVLNEDGILAITVPPLQEIIVGGHVHIYNAGLLLYNLVLAGFDCSNASVLSYDYNISVILRKKTIKILSELEYDRGDIRKIKKYLPKDIKFFSNDMDDPFHGKIEKLNWTF